MYSPHCRVRHVQAYCFRMFFLCPKQEICELLSGLQMMLYHRPGSTWDVFGDTLHANVARTVLQMCFPVAALRLRCQPSHCQAGADVSCCEVLRVILTHARMIEVPFTLAVDTGVCLCEKHDMIVHWRGRLVPHPNLRALSVA